jgi:hypothetical protein
MPEDRITIRQWLERMAKRDWTDKSVSTAIDDGWYDWFCKDGSLTGRLAAMLPMIRRVVRSSKVDQDKMYIFLKNNSPVYGSLYDDFRICSMETNKVIYTVTPQSGFEINNGRAEVWGQENEFKEALMVGEKRDIYTFFEV